MPLRLPDQYHRPGVALVRVGRFVKVALATDAKPVTVTVGKLRVPAQIAEGPATFVGAFLTHWDSGSDTIGSCAILRDLAETVRCEAERLTGHEFVAGDFIQMDEHELETVIGMVESRWTVSGPVRDSGGRFVRYDDVVPYRTSTFDADLSTDTRRTARTAPTPIEVGSARTAQRVETNWIKPVPPREVVRRVQRVVNGGEAEAIRERQRMEAELAQNRRRQRAAARAPGTAGGTTKTRTYPLSRTPIRSRKERATRAQYDYLVALGAAVDVSAEAFTTRLTKRKASSAIDTQKAGVRHVTITT
jgi:hypothetical protein